jgi:hypothetical protein
MTNKPKAIGTFGEVSIVPVLKPYFPQAERLTLKGENDEGDIGHCGEFIFEVKWGNIAERAKPLLIEKWLDEARREADTRRVRWGILVTKRIGYGRTRAAQSWAWMRAGEFVALTGGTLYGDESLAPVRLELCALLLIMAANGWTLDAPDAAA